MRIFVAGATGVLGRALMPLLLQKGYIVRALARTIGKMRALELAGIEAVQGDLLSPETAKQLAEIIQGCNAVVHIATAIPSDRNAPGAWDITARLRTEGTRLLLQASLATGVQRYIQQSIVMAYPDGGEHWLDEQTPLDASPERATICGPVIAMEDMIWDISPEQLRWGILRGGSFVGPETAQDEQIAQLRAGQLVVPCDGSNFFSPVHVTDMARAIVSALESAPPGSVFNIVDEPIRNGDYLDHLADLLGVPHPPRNPSRPCPPSHSCSNHAARTVLGWTPSLGIWPAPEQYQP
jgi:nucleoside-diphosphate-sugar epimerase